MMKSLCSICVISIYLLLSSCINTISGDEQEDGDQNAAGSIAVKVSASKLHSQIYNKDFESAIGAYLLLGSSSIEKDRYMDNEKFLCTSSGFSSINSIFYPASKEKCNLLAYYPYQDSAFEPGGASLRVSVNANQTSLINYNLSDFMTAEVNNLAPSTKSVVLDFERRFSQLSIIIKCSDDFSVEGLRKLNPSITILGVFAEANYNISSNEFGELSAKLNITPNGNWTVDKNKLVGKKGILIPQTIPAYTDFITLNIGDETYSLQLSENYNLSSGTSNEITIVYSPKIGVDNLITQINDWNEGESAEVTPIEKVMMDKITVTDFDFSRNPVYNITNINGEVIAEVCKEYLLDEEFDGEYIVVYPVKEHSIDLSNGVLWHSLSESDKLLGGTVFWDILTNSFTYSGGNLNHIPFIYFDKDGWIHLSEIEGYSKVSLSEKVLCDVRGDELIIYPVVKIASQHWLAEDLKTVRYHDGTAISKKTSANYSKKTAGYFQVDSNIYYNQAAIKTGKVAPYGWRIADYQDWELLKDYLHGESSVLKKKNLWGNNEYVANNRTGFNFIPVGLFNNVEELDESGFSFNNQYVAYWSMGASTQTLWDKGILLSYMSNEIKNASYSDYSGFCVRCIEN